MPVGAVAGATGSDRVTGAKPGRGAPNPTWAALMQRGFGFDVLACPRCWGRLRLVAAIQGRRPSSGSRHLGVPDTVPVARLSRAPPGEGEVVVVLDG